MTTPLPWPELKSKWQRKVTLALPPLTLIITMINIDIYGEAGILVTADPMDAVFTVMTLDELYNTWEPIPPSKSCGTCFHYDAAAQRCEWARNIPQPYWLNSPVFAPSIENGANCKAHQPK